MIHIARRKGVRLDFSWELMTTVLYLNLLITTTQAAEKVKAYHLVTLSFRWYHSYKQGKKNFMTCRIKCIFILVLSNLISAVKDLTSLLEFVITLVIIEINGANFAPIFF